MPCVYQHRNIITGEPFYIGFSLNLSRPFQNWSRSEAWHKIVNDSNGEYLIDILFEVKKKRRGLNIEEIMINKIGVIKDGGTLVNNSYTYNARLVEIKRTTKIPKEVTPIRTYKKRLNNWVIVPDTEL